MKKFFSISLFTLISGGVFCQSPSDTISKGTFILTAEPGISQMQQLYIESAKNTPELDGYRVQIYNGSKQKTLEIRSSFINIFPNVPVYTVYETPEYKVQVGDFRTRLEAEYFLNKVVKEFGSGFVARTKIKYPITTE